MKKIEVLKQVGACVISVGVTAILSNIVEETTPEETGTFKRVCIGLGCFVLGNMIAEKATAYAEDQATKIVTEIKEVINDKE